MSEDDWPAFTVTTGIATLFGMPYPVPTDEQLRRFDADGFLVVENAIDPQELDALVRMGHEMIERPLDPKANDWDWRRGESHENRVYRIVQSAVDRHYPWLVTSAFRTWAASFGGLLMHQDMEFWYEQFLGKPPGTGAPTPWHQDEAYWGRTLRDRGVTCWTAFHSVRPENGCMHFVRGGHKRLLQHRNPPEMASDLLVCDIPQDAEVVVCPIDAGTVTFHHSKTPHMTTGNTSGAWRLVLTQHFRNPACKDLPEDNYSWRVHVNQRTGERRAER
ncbi:MAG TPA: phytanoyl-CoA dioxygenase family protein [Steroidobacteraceae bacterium]|nr:phytanoyl-CoA dioxygenase family protein [Steroidobacteraceae bacterium]